MGARPGSLPRSAHPRGGPGVAARRGLRTDFSSAPCA
jgi:hypothetical protein